jgi:uncharacterized protein (DUF433 family)
MAAMRAPRRPRIVRDDRILGGAPIIRGTRVPVRAIAFLWRATGDRARIQHAYPSLSSSDVDEAIQYYEVHRAEIDDDLLDEQGEGD